MDPQYFFAPQTNFPWWSTNEMNVAQNFYSPQSEHHEAWPEELAEQPPEEVAPHEQAQEELAPREQAQEELTPQEQPQEESTPQAASHSTTDDPQLDKVATVTAVDSEPFFKKILALKDQGEELSIKVSPGESESAPDNSCQLEADTQNDGFTRCCFRHGLFWKQARHSPHQDARGLRVRV